MNPTTDVLEKRIAELDGGVGALGVASGQSAITLSLLNIARAGDEIVSADNLYGGTYNLFHYTFPSLGIKVHFVKSQDLAAFQKAITPKTKAVYAESIGNPKLDVADLEALSKIAHGAGVPLVLDNTVSPYLLKPFDHGVDIAVYSATKFIGGHGTSIGGLIVDSGKFDWKNGKHPLIARPRPELPRPQLRGGAQAFRQHRLHHQGAGDPAARHGPGAVPLQLLPAAPGLRDPARCACSATRRTPSPRRAGSERHPKVSWVNYPGLASSSQNAKAKKYLPRGAGALIGFGVKGGVEAGRRFINALKLTSHLANIGDAKTLAIQPATTTHQQLSPEEQLATGVTPDFIRLSVGLEHIDDIAADLDQALAKA